MYNYLSTCCFKPVWLTSVCHHLLYETKDKKAETVSLSDSIMPDVCVSEKAMARGQQKIQSQQKNAKKAAEKKKSQGADQKTAAKAALVHTCPVCRVRNLCDLSDSQKVTGLICCTQTYLDSFLKKFCYSVYRHRCQTPKPLNSILKANTQNLLCLLSWWTFKPKGHKNNMDLKQGWV